MGHKMAIHVEHYKRGSVGALEHHNLRENETYSNKDIDRERSKDNLVILQPSGSQYAATKQIIESRAVNQVRSTSIWQSEFVISSDREFFAALPKEEQDRFFRESYEYLKTEFGADNVTCAAVHYDETTPHMHFDFVPMTEDNKLSRKEVMTRDRLIKIQDELPRYLKEKGFDIERGRRMDEIDQKARPRHIDTKEYKKAINDEMKALEMQEKKLHARQHKLDESVKRFETEEKKLNSRIEDHNARLKSLNAESRKVMKEIEELPKAEKSITGKMQMTTEDYNKLRSSAQYGITAHKEYINNKRLKDQLQDQSVRYQSLKRDYDKLRRESNSIDKKLKYAEIEAENQNLRLVNKTLRNALQLLAHRLQEIGVAIPRTAARLLEESADQQTRG